MRFAVPAAVLYPVLVLCAVSSTATAQENVSPGEAVYAKACATCHDHPAPRLPSRAVLQQRTAAFILKTLNSGVMKEQGATLAPPQRALVAQWLGRTTALSLDKTAVTNPCRTASVSAPNSPAWTGWGAGLENLRFQPASSAGISSAQAAHLKLKWAFGVPDVTALRAQPAVYNGTLLFGGGAILYALDAASGCTRWATEMPASVRTGIAIGTPAGKPLAFFGDGAANVYAVDVATGAPVWQIKADTHPAAMATATPAYFDGRLYVSVSSQEEVTALTPGYVCCTFRGSIVAVDAASGKTVWQTYTIDREATEARVNKLGAASKGPSGVAVWSAPTIDTAAHVLYAATGDNYSDPASETSDAVLSLDLNTGKVAWTHQFRAGDAFNVACVIPGMKSCPDAGGPDFDFGSSPLLLSLTGGKRVLILAQKSGEVYAVDPDDHGKPLWRTQLGKGGTLGGIEWGPATDSERIYAAISDEAFLTTGGLDPDKGGGLYALSVSTGNVLWNAPASPCSTREHCSPAQTAAVTATPGLVFSGSLSGHIRAFAAADGKVLWDFDTMRDFPTVNGIPAHGGSISVAGPVVAGGVVYILSGYDTFGETPGNVLLAFTPDGN